MDEPVKSRNFSLAFEQMCNFAAIAKTQDADETLRQLILLCLVILPEEKFQNAAQIMEAINLFGLQFPEYQVQAGLERLIAQGRIQHPANTYFTLPDQDRKQLQERIDAAKALENRVKEEWLEEIARKFSVLSPDQAWKGLQGYLARVFRVHGIRTAALFDPSNYTPPEYVENLSLLLNDALKETFAQERQAMARGAISGFLDSVGDHVERTKYIAQLSDGVFTYFSLTVEPKVAQLLHKKLNPLTLFFDTNFLLGILNLQTIKSYGEVSNELLRITEKYKFPFKLRYHPATEREMRSTISHYGAVLRSGQVSPVLSGIELEYYRRNAATGIDVDSFLKPYEHVDYILKSKNILIHRMQAERRREHAHLLQEYKKFLEVRGRSKPDQMLEHDITILDAVHQLRTKAKSSLEAGALLITWDNFLYMFEWETSRAQGRPTCVVLPDQFMQVLRPFVPSDSDFDRSFAEAFAIIEFRAIDSKVSEAQHQFFSDLNAYELFPEEIAASLLTNGLLIERLDKAENDEHFQKSAESAMTHENALLLEENAELAKLLERVRAERTAKEKQLEQERSEVEQLRARVAQAEQLLQQKEKEVASLKKPAGRQGPGEAKQQREQREQALEIARREQQAREEAEKRAELEALLRRETERKVHMYAWIASFTISLILIVIFELCIKSIQGPWFIQHQGKYGLQIAIDTLFLFTTTGFFHPHLRNVLWGVGALALLSTVLQLL
jgi:hypothetical protein